MTLQKNDFLFICCQLMRHPLIKLFYLSNLLQMLNDSRMVNIEFFGNFSHSYERISSDDSGNCLLSTTDGLPLCSSSRFSFAKLLEPPLHCMFISSSWAKCVVDVASCLHCFMTYFELKKMACICFLSNFISLV